MGRTLASWPFLLGSRVLGRVNLISFYAEFPPGIPAYSTKAALQSWYTGL